MKLEKVLPALRKGERVRRKGFSDGFIQVLSDRNNREYCLFFIEDIPPIEYFMSTEDMLADDWEILE